MSSFSAQSMSQSHSTSMVNGKIVSQKSHVQSQRLLPNGRLIQKDIRQKGRSGFVDRLVQVKVDGQTVKNKLTRYPISRSELEYDD